VLEPFAISEGVTPTTRYRKNGKKAYKSRNSAPARARSARSAGVLARKSKFQSQQSPDSRQDMTQDQGHHTPIQYYTPPIMDQCNLSPYTPDCHQPFIGSHYQPGSSILDNLGQYNDIKPVQVDDGGMIYMDEHEHYGDRFPYVWTNSHYY
jgi:hypothetical protein